MKPKVAIVRGKFLNAYEMQFFEPLTAHYNLTAFGSLTCFHDRFAFPVIKLPCPLDVPDFFGKLPILNRLFIDAHYLFGLENRLVGFDLVHTAETYFHYTQQCLNAKRRGYVRKVIATVLENIPFNNEGIWGRHGFKKRARRELDHIIALTNKTKEALLEEGANPNKISVIGHFVDTRRFHPSAAASKRRKSENPAITVLFSGRLEDYKGVFDILEAAKRMTHDTNLHTYRIQWIFVGEGLALGRMLAIEKQNGLVPFVTHLSAAYDRMPEMYEKADIFVAPSKPTKTYDEQYCTSLLEAQAMGLPIVSTKTGGIPENVGDAAVLIKPGDPIRLAKEITSFIVNPKKREQYATYARRRAETVHDIRIGANKLSNLYNIVLSG
jgi:glycosyltransferase involved in cell wall biosynthesis